MFRFPDKWHGLAFPHVRVALIGFLDALGDPARTEAWRDASTEETQTGIRQLLFFLYDAHDFGPAAIGFCLLDRRELALIAALKRVLAEIAIATPGRGSGQFLDHPLWPEVLAAAEVAREALTARGRAIWVEES